VILRAVIKSYDSYDALWLTVDIGALNDETKALEELSRQLFLESVDLHNEQVIVWLCCRIDPDCFLTRWY